MKTTPILFLILCLFTASHVFAMGGDSIEERDIPLPAKNYSVTIQDVKGVTTDASRVSWNGKIYFQGKRGESLTTVSFSKVKKVTILRKEKTPKGSIATDILLTSGDTIRLYMESTSKCFGETSFGKFEIYLQDLRNIEFK